MAGIWRYAANGLNCARKTAIDVFSQADITLVWMVERSPKYYPSGIYKRWKKHCPNHRLHDARHTNATLLYEATNSLRLVQKQLGHASIGTTQVYADVRPEQSIAGVTAMERLATTLKRNPRGMAATLPASGVMEATA